MQLKHLNEAFDHKITGGSDSLWQCYPNGRYIDYASEYAEISAVFNSQTGQVYEIECYPLVTSGEFYRWVDPIVNQAVLDEYSTRGLDPSKAIDDDKWVDLETEEDILEKSKAVFNNLPYDKRISVPLILSEAELSKLMLIAHHSDVTLNQLVTSILEDTIAKAKAEQKGLNRE